MLANVLRPLIRTALSHYVANGVVAAFGLLLVGVLVRATLGGPAASVAAIGVIVCIPPDQASAQKGKFWHLLPAAAIGVPLFFGVQMLHAQPVWLGLLLLPATFLSFLAAAWGKRGVPVAVSAMFSVIFSMAAAARAGVAQPLADTTYFALGAALYLGYAVAANALLNTRYRHQMLAATLLALVHLMRSQAAQLVHAPTQGPRIGVLLQLQSALSDQLQSARDLLLESPETPERQRLAAMLIGVIELRDHLLACQLDLDTITAHDSPTLLRLRAVLLAMALDVEQLADALLRKREPSRFADHHGALRACEAAPHTDSPDLLVRALASRMVHLNEGCMRLSALARGELAPDLPLIRATWQMFVSPAHWSWRPFLSLWRWDAPPLRHALRATLAIAFAYPLSLLLPWGSHAYWILLTIVVVLRGSLAQTLERRNARVLGTLLGCLLAGAILWAQWPHWALLLVLTLAQALAHAFMVRRYLVTAVAATVLGLVQAHLLSQGGHPVFEVAERMGDTLLGGAIAWAFSYVLPSWEQQQIPKLVLRTRVALARYARASLALGQTPGQDAPGLAWRLARRECFDSLSALVQAVQRSLAEPRAVRVPLEPLERIVNRGYQLLAQLTAIKTMLLTRRQRLQGAAVEHLLLQSSVALNSILLGPTLPTLPASVPEQDTLPDPFVGDLTPWLARRLQLAQQIAVPLAQDAEGFR